MESDKLSYLEKLKTRKWRCKSNEIKARDHYTCQICKKQGEPLQVHHQKYIGVDPWDTPNEYLITLCPACHKGWHMLANGQPPAVRQLSLI